MEEAQIRTIRESYDRLAKQYAQRLAGELDYKPLDRKLLDRFADKVKGLGEVCDLGCGPGHVARYLCDAGVVVFGLDLSSEMLCEARSLNPTISFRDGNILSLDIPSRSLAGIAAFYAIVNFPKESLKHAFEEMARVLKPDGLLLAAFHIGNDVVHVDNLWGVPIALDFMLFNTSDIAKEIQGSGLVVEEIIERDPYPEVEYQSRRAYVFARKPAA